MIFCFYGLKFPDGSEGSRLGGVTTLRPVISHIKRKGKRCEENIWFSKRSRQSLMRDAHCDCDGGWVTSLPSCTILALRGKWFFFFLLLHIRFDRYFILLDERGTMPEGLIICSQLPTLHRKYFIHIVSPQLS